MKYLFISQEFTLFAKGFLVSLAHYKALTWNVINFFLLFLQKDILTSSVVPSRLLAVEKVDSIKQVRTKNNSIEDRLFLCFQVVLRNVKFCKAN